MRWFSGSGHGHDFEDIMHQIKLHSLEGGKIFIGCDSQIVRDRCIFSTVICLHGANNQKGGYYFFSREKLKRESFPTMLMRLTTEVEKSITIASRISELNEDVDIEIHIDANSKKGEKTGRFADMLVGYAKGAGFRCKIKPDAWASNSIADKHSK